MNLRFRVLSQPYNVLPSAYSCAAAGVVVDKALVGLKIEINGVEFFDDAAGTLTDVTTHGATVGGVAATFGFENTDYYKLNLDLATPHDSATVKIIITAFEGYRSYTNEFKVFGYDIGNNPNIAYPLSPPFPGNPDFDITLVPLTFVPGGPDLPSTNAYPCTKALVYRATNSDEVHIVKSNSAPGDYFVFDASGGLVATGEYAVIEDPGNNLQTLSFVGIKADTASPTKLSGVPTPSDPNDVSSLGFAVPNKVTDIPSLSMAITTPGVCDSGCTCIQDGSTVTFTFEGGDLIPLITNDTYVFGGYATFYINIYLKAYDGTVLDTVTQAINIDINSPGVTVVYNYAIPSSLDFDSYYVLQIDVTDGVNTLDTESYELKSCSLAELTRSTCGDMTYTNLGPDAVVTVKSVAEDGTLTEINSYTVLVGEEKEFSLSDGVYIVEVYRGDVLQYSYKIFVYCTIANCITSFLQSIGCEDPCANTATDCGCGCGGSTTYGKDITTLYNFTAFMLTAMTYLQTVNAIYATNWIFTVLPSDELTHLTELVKLHDRLTKYCIGCS